jgi:7-cyano-7-deazaguanine synthase
VLAIAREQGYRCHTLAVSYGQRHAVELRAAAQQSVLLGAVEHREMHVDLAQVGGSSLTDPALAVPVSPSTGIPSTYVPARNTLLLALALGWAEVVEADDLFIGVNAVDYSGYPDCRPAFIEAFQSLARVATKAGVDGRPLSVQAPLLHWSKARIILEGQRLGVDYSATVSCYQANVQGEACGRCDSCRLRREGFAAAGVVDPTRYAAAS